MKDNPAQYWDTLFEDRTDLTEPGAWRQVCDRLYRNQIGDWLSGVQVPRALKTDLYDESSGLGLVPDLFGYAQQVDGVDVSAAIVTQAAKNHPRLSAVAGDVRDLPFAAERFDLILSNSTLDHFGTQAEIHTALAELYRVLVPGGRMYISLDNPANPVLALRRILPFKLLNRLGLVPYFCGATLGREALRKALIEAGFEVIREGILMHVPRVFAVQICRFVDWVGRPKLTAAVVSMICAAEVARHLPTARFTGHYVVALAQKPGA